MSLFCFLVAWQTSCVCACVWDRKTKGKWSYIHSMCTDTDQGCNSPKKACKHWKQECLFKALTPTCWNPLSEVLELGLKSLPVVFFPWCFESAPFSNTVAECSTLWRLPCALHVWDGWKLLWWTACKGSVTLDCWDRLFSCLTVSTCLIFFNM